MINFDKVKLVLFDFDDTLCIHRDHGSGGDREYNRAMILGDCGWWDRRGCKPSVFMGKFMQLCVNSGKQMGLISVVEFSCAAAVKLSWVEANYGYVLRDYCTGSFEGKVQIIQAILDSSDLQPENMLFVDDLYANLAAVEKLGVQVCSPMEVINYVTQS